MALTLRLWHLGDPHTLVFDEVYYVPFALDYLQGGPSFDAHPPLAKYLIALGLWLGQWLTAWLDWPQLEVEGLLVSPLAYRWLNALVGASIPVLLAALAFALSEGYSSQRRRTFALLAGLLMTMEGLTLVESRLALINIYGLALGLLGQWAWIRAGRSQHPSRWRWLAAIALGAAISVKWNWAGFWLGLLLWDLATSMQSSKFKIQNSGRLIYLGLVPLTTYLLLWLPHLAMTGESLGEVHRQLWSTHQSIGANGNHAYCSPWHSWPLMVRPVAYFFERSGQGSEAIAITIHAMGNPVLWWLSTAAVLALALGWLARRILAGAQHAAPLQTHAVVPFILLNYLANWLPWALVSRCTFLYHAMGMVAFSALGLAWLMAQWWQNPRDRPLALLLLGAIALSFWFWLPLYLGLPLSPASLHRRWLLPGWI
ncbi:dolichyl-phosphate-mannose--protein O-mannosyl transferase [filamentous cyanobacterium CCT1]|nr:dolichyl-phosphate-mannose--protein O-mannosyl transferase [filamentous cyanobacterium CCT1]PSN77631.1 dolichyl-phosphate-mannose--protein O-mannosyl transferase [filamentous cyanobacterium CCP4]